MKNVNYFIVWLAYNLGQLAAVLATAYIVSKSTLNSVATVRHYLKLRAIPLGIRWMLCNFLFFVVWENPAVIDLSKYLTTYMVRFGGAGILGFFSDQVWDKTLAVVFPGMNKPLPQVPSPLEDSTK